MTAPLTLLIVEDETPLAEMHAEYIRHIPGFSQILLAGNLVQARMMIERFKPGLIFNQIRQRAFGNSEHANL